LSAAVARAREGDACVVVVQGEAGSGKSWLLEQLISSVTRPRSPSGSLSAAGMPDIQLLRASGHPAEQALPFAGLHQLLHPVRARIDTLPDIQRDAVGAALALQARSSTPPAQQFAVAAGVHTLLTTLAEERPLLVVVDDVHWLDTATIQTLGFVARRLDSDPVALVLATRPMVDAHPFADASAVVELGPLGDDDARELLRTAHPELVPAVADEVIRVAAGLPLALVEVPADLRPEQRRGEVPLTPTLPAGPTLDRLFSSRLGELDEDAETALLLASLDELDRDELSQALAAVGLSVTALEPAERVGLVLLHRDGITFSHPLVRSAVQRRARETARRRGHAVLADLFGDSPDRRAWHLHEMADGVDATVAEALAAAAAAAEARAAPAEAGRAWEAAASRSTTRAEAAPRLTRAAGAYLRAGDATASRRVFDGLVAASVGPVERARCERGRLVTASWAAFERPDADHVLGLAASASPTAPDVAAALLGDLGLGLMVAGRWSEAARVMADARANTSASGPSLRNRLVDDMVAVMVGAPGAGALLRSDWDLELTDAALCDPELPAVHAASVRCWIGDPDGAARVLARMHTSLQRTGAVGMIGVIVAALADVDQRVGDWDKAAAGLETAERLCAATGLLAPLAFVRLRYALLLAARGADTACRDRLEAGAAAAGDLPLVSHLVEVALGQLALGAGRTQDAVDHLVRAGEIERREGMREPAYTSRSADLVEAWWRLRHEDEAAAELDRFSRDAEAVDRPSALAELARSRALLVATEDIDEAFATVLARFAPLRDPFGHARAELCWGERLRRAGRKHDARTPLRGAADTFGRLGADAWARRALAELAACGERRVVDAGPASVLTPQELQVAMAVANGSSNPEVAAALYLSRRTVEYHLSSAYRKLGVRDRHELAALLRPQV